MVERVDNTRPIGYLRSWSGHGVMMPHVRFLAAALAWTVGILWSGLAAAEDQPPTAAPEPASAATASPPESGPEVPELDRVERARSLYEQAGSRYDAGDIVGALDLMQKSYELSGRPELLFNLGQLNRQLGRCPAALARYREYLALAPAGHRREDAARTIEQLARECPEPVPASPAKPPAPAAGPVVRRYWTTPRVLGWTAVAAGVAAGAGALALGLTAYNANVEAHDPNRDGDKGAELEQDSKRYEAWGIGLGVAGAAAVAGGVLLLVFGSPRHEAAPAVSVVAEPRGVRAAYSVHF